MSSLTGADDIRSVKTERALYTAMLFLLKSYSFKKITVKGICEKALISRAAFYAHFIDKYDLLEHWLKNYWAQHFSGTPTYEQLERILNDRIYANQRIFKNLIFAADTETYDILFKLILSTKNLTLEQTGDGNAYRKNVVVSHFYAGGILSYILWQIKNGFPKNTPLINRELYDMIREFQAWQNKRRDKQEVQNEPI